MTNTQFIQTIAPLAQKAFKELGKVKPSVCISMACCESGYGRAKSANFNSFIGQKVGTGKTATKYWGGKFFTSKTQEEYVVGQHTVITAAFRAYDSMEQCVFNYYELLNAKLYNRVLAASPWDQQLDQIKLVGYMTSSTEIDTCKDIVRKNNLTLYDKIVITDAEDILKPTPAAAKDTVQYYVVQKGDSLWKIAQKVYGKGTLYPKIVQANNIKNNFILPGQKIIIPKV